MTNPYKKFLDTFFETITDFKHTSNRVNKVLLKDVDIYTADAARYFSGTKLAIEDWTGPTDNGWKINFLTGIQKATYKENYAFEIEKILSREFGFIFSQSYEALETLLKDFVDIKIKTNQNFKAKLPSDKDYSRGNLKGGDDIFKLITKAGGARFEKYSNRNNNHFRFKAIFRIFSEVRHALTHSKGNLKVSKIPNDKYYYWLFEHLFPLNNIKSETIELKFEYQTLDKLLIYMSEFGYQIFKVLSEEDGYEWNYNALHTTTGSS